VGLSEADWKQRHANDADKALRHPLVEGVIDEQLMNLGREGDSLARYGLSKIAHYAAQVARAQALGFDPELLTLTPDEANRALMERAAAMVFAGVPTTIIAPEGSVKLDD
jgi:hypothetical protein